MHLKIMKTAFISSVKFKVFLSLSVLTLAVLGVLSLIPERTDAQAGPKPRQDRPFRTESHEPGLENYDIRDDKSSFMKLASFRNTQGVAAFEVADITDSMAQAEISFEAANPGATVEARPSRLGPEVIAMSAFSKEAALTKPSNDSRVNILKRFLGQNEELVGVSSVEVMSLETVADYSTLEGEIGYAVLTQKIDGIPVFQGEVRAGFTKKGEIVRVINNLAPGLGGSASDFDFGSPELAVSYAFGHINRKADKVNLEFDGASSSEAKLVFGKGDDATTAEKIYFPTEPGIVVAAWKVLIWQPTNAYYVIVDAKSGTLLWRKNIAEDQTQAASYGVYRNPNAMIDVADSPFPFTPGPTSPNGAQGAGIPRTVLSRIGNEGVYSFNLLGFLPDGVFKTDGNYVHAGIDRDGVNGIDPNGEAFSATRQFVFNYNPLNPNTNLGDSPLPEIQTYPPSEFQQGTVTQMFWATNWVLSELYRLGFTEQARNFQNDNFGRGGLAGDRVRAEGQDYAGVNNANFSTPADGAQPRMQMYLWTAGGTQSAPRLDGNLDADVLIHEIIHGLSNRLIGNATGLSTNMARGMGEGWSDFYAHAMLSEPTDPIFGIYTTGGYDTFLLSGFFQNNYYYGIRRFPKAVMAFTGGPNDRPHNPLTFADIDATQINTTDGAFPAAFNSSAADQVHAAGEVWSSALWEVRCRMVDRLGWEVGNRRALQIITDGMKLTPNAPTFIQARDAIITVARSMSLDDLEDVWRGFAIRGMGASAVVLNRGTGGGTARVIEAFDFPGISATGPLSVSDTTGGNGNGFAEPGESILLSVPVVNNNWAAASSVSLTINGGLPFNLADIAGGASTTITVPFSIPESAQCGSDITLNIQLQSSLGSLSVSNRVVLGVPQRTFFEDFDSVSAPEFPRNWATSVQANSPESFVITTLNAQTPPNSAYIRNTSTVGGAASLISPSIPIQQSGAIVQFAHRYASEAGWDGGVLELSINDGPFVDVIEAGGDFLSNGYNGILGAGTNNPLSNRSAWNGSSGGFIVSAVRLPSNVAGNSIKLRWRFGADDNTVGTGPNPGWNIDNVEVFGAASCNSACTSSIPLMIPDVEQFPNAILEVPIMIGDLTGQGADAFDFTFRFDGSILAPLTPAVDSSNTLASNFTIISNQTSSNTLRVSGFGIQSLSGQGALLKLRFLVTGTRSATSSLGFDKFVINEGAPCVSVSNGTFTVKGGEMSGIVEYFFGRSPVRVRGVVLQASGSINLNDVTSRTGSFLLQGFGGGEYAVTASKMGDITPGTITSLDASVLAQWVVGLVDFTPNQLLAADVTNDGTVSSLDASRIAQWSVGLPLPAGDLTGTWKFVPATRTFSSVTTSVSGQNFTAILMGDVTGNWTPSPPVLGVSSGQDK
jgi:hypothetical protein